MRTEMNEWTVEKITSDSLVREVGKGFEPKANTPTHGSADLCFITETPLLEVIEQINRYGAQIEEGPVRRTGALGPIESVYLRDPDHNLIEISDYVKV